MFINKLQTNRLIMLKKLSIYTFQVSILLLETTTNLIQPQYSIKILNTENIILSLGAIDDDTNDDLEIIKTPPENPKMEKKLYDFHKYINLADKAELSKEKEFRPNTDLYNYILNPSINYPDSPYEIAMDEKDLSRLERRKKKKTRKKRLKRMAETDNEWPKSKRKRHAAEPQPTDDVEEYNYIEKEYFDYLEQSQKNNKAFKYSDEGKPEESIKDVVNKITDFKTPKNCTNITGIGLQAMECVVKNFQDGVFDQQQMLYSISILVLVWICIYLVIALPLWCCKGWCCCCCRCSFCFPTRTVRDIQKYIAQNPPGTYRNPKGKEEHYNPTQRETELYERIKRSIAEF